MTTLPYLSLQRGKLLGLAIFAMVFGIATPLISVAADAPANKSPQSSAVGAYTGAALQKRAVDAQVAANVGYFGQGSVPPSLIAKVAQADQQYYADTKAAVAPVAQTVTFAVTSHDLTLHSALEKWLAAQGWQLAWKIPDELPIEFNGTFTEPNMKAVLWDVMKATDHMSTPSRICRHMPNKVVRVVARAVNCKE